MKALSYTDVMSCPFSGALSPSVATATCFRESTGTPKGAIRRITCQCRGFCLLCLLGNGWFFEALPFFNLSKALLSSANLMLVVWFRMHIQFINFPCYKGLGHTNTSEQLSFMNCLLLFFDKDSISFPQFKHAALLIALMGWWLFLCLSLPHYFCIFMFCLLVEAALD